MGGGFGRFGTASWNQVLNGLTPGVTYQVNFKMASEGTFSGPQSLTVEFPSGSSTLAQTFTAAAPTTNYWTQWESKSMNFTATNNQVELVFTASTEYDVALDSVNVTVAPLRIDFIPPLTNGQFLLRVTGEPGTNYMIQVATNLVSSDTSWTPLFTSNSMTGTFEFLDIQATNPNRFYRVVSQ